MNNIIMLLIAVDDETLRSRCISAFSLPNINLIKCGADNVLIEVTVMKYKPHAVIISSDNLEKRIARSLVKDLSAMNQSPIIINLYTYENYGLIEDLENLGVSRSYSAPFDLEQIAADVCNLCSLIPGDVKEGFGEIRRRIYDVMCIFNFNNSMQGYNYIREAIFIVVTQMNGKFNFSKDIYPKIAEKYEISAASVERAIRVSISNSWKRTNENIRRMFFNRNSLKNYNKPTNSEFILTISDYIKSEFSDFLDEVKKEKELLTSDNSR